MKLRYQTPMLLALAGCASGPPSLAANGYERVAIPQGCYGHGAPKEYNVRLNSELEQQLVDLLPHKSSAARCWYEHEDGSLVLTIGDGCSPHQEAIFERLGTMTLNQQPPVNMWSLEHFKDVPIVLCDERRS